MGSHRSSRVFAVFTGCLVLAAVVCWAGFSVADDCRRVQNIVVLFDASGFMKSGDRYRHFLESMGSFENAMPLTADGFFNVGLRHYGLKVGLGCNNTEAILAVGPWDPERFVNSFPKTISYGMSSLSAGLIAAAQDASAAEGKTILLVIGGGLESCKADPVKTAEQIAANMPDLEIHTFQVGSEQEGTYFLQSIAEKGRGTYNRLRDFSSPAGWHQWMKRYLVVPCGPAQPAVSQAPARINAVLFDYKTFSVRSKNPQIDGQNLAALQAVAAFLQQNPTGKVILHGFSDGKGSQTYNLELSRRRAEAVARYLADTYKVPMQRISVVAHGIAQDALRSAPGAAQPEYARRVEFELVR
ncbi:MAG: OmpA family protein [Thermodesulfobacteriota bacterium]